MVQKLTVWESNIIPVTKGGATELLFPEAEAMLNDAKYVRALKFFAFQNNTTKYQSLLDFLFCEFYVEWKEHVFNFYTNHVQFSILKKEDVRFYDIKLCAALRSAFILYSNRHHSQTFWHRYYVVAMSCMKYHKKKI